MEDFIAYFKKHPAFAWIGVGVLAVGAYIIGKSAVAAPATTTGTSTPQSTGSYNYFYGTPAQPPTTDTTATPGTTATPATTPTEPAASFIPPQLTNIVTATHPAGIVDNTIPYLSSPQYQYATTGHLLPTSSSPITLPALPSNGSFTNLGNGQYQVVGGNTGYSIGQILHIIPPSNKGAAVYGQSKI